jgi:hypothetical protein
MKDLAKSLGTSRGRVRLRIATARQVSDERKGCLLIVESVKLRGATLLYGVERKRKPERWKLSELVHNRQVKGRR